MLWCGANDLTEKIPGAISCPRPPRVINLFWRLKCYKKSKNRNLGCWLILCSFLCLVLFLPFNNKNWQVLEVFNFVICFYRGWRKIFEQSVFICILLSDFHEKISLSLVLEMDQEEHSSLGFNCVEMWRKLNKNVKRKLIHWGLSERIWFVFSNDYFQLINWLNSSRWSQLDIFRLVLLVIGILFWLVEIISKINRQSILCITLLHLLWASLTYELAEILFGTLS